MGHFELLFLQDVEAMDCVHDIIPGGPDPVVEQGASFFFMKRLIGEQVIHNACGGAAERVWQDTVDPDT